MIESLYLPRNAFLPFHLRQNRWACLVAHRRAGKTVACINELLTRALATSRSDARYGYIAPFYSQAKQIAWDYLKFYGAPVIVKINESELMVELINGSKIRLFGADNYNALRGLYFDGVVLDEYADMRPSVWGEVIRPALTDRKGWAVFIGTPKGQNAFYDIFKTSQENSDWFSLVLRASESGLLPTSELLDARATMSEDQYEQEFECSFSAAILGSYYGKLMNQAQKDERICSVPYNSAFEVNTAWDIGGDGTAIWFWQVVGKEPRIIDFYESIQGDLMSDVAALKGKGYNYGKHILPHDAGHDSVRTGTTMFRQITDLGLRNCEVLPRDAIDTGIELVRRLIPQLWFDKTKCDAGITALINYQRKWDEERKIFAQKPLHDWSSHAADAMRYLATYMARTQTSIAPARNNNYYGNFRGGANSWQMM